MILNLMRIEDVDPENMVRCSLHQFQCDKALPALSRRSNALLDEYGALQIEREEQVKTYFKLSKHIERVSLVISYTCSASRRCA